MSNATVSSQVYIVRNADALAAVSTGTMIVYADGTDLFAKDASNNVYNLTHPSASSISLAINDLTDVSITGLTADSGNTIHVLRYDVSTSQWVNDDLDMELAELSNVSDTAPSANQVLQWNGTAWAPATISAGSGITALHEASDVIDYDAGTAPEANQGLVWNSSNNQFELADLVQSFTMTDGSNNIQVDNADTITLTGTSPISVAGNAGNSTFTVSFSGSLTDLSDTSSSFSALSAGQVLRYSGTAFTNAPLSVFDLSNVDENAVTLSDSAGADKVLAWDQTEEAFVPVDAVSSIDDLSDVDTTTVAPTDGQALVWDNANSQWEPGTVSGSGIALTDLSVGTEGTASGDGAVAYDNATGEFTYTPPTAAGIGALADITGESLEDLSNVAITSLASGEVLEYDGSNWVNSSAAAGYSAESFALTQHQVVVVKKTITGDINHNVNLSSESWWNTVTGDSTINSADDTITLNIALRFPVRSTMDTDGTNTGIIKFNCSSAITSDIPISIQGRLRDPKNGGSIYNGSVTVSGDMVFSNSTIGAFTLTTANISDICVKQIMQDNGGTLSSLDGLTYELVVVFGGTPSANITNESFTVAELTIPMEM